MTNDTFPVPPGSGRRSLPWRRPFGGVFLSALLTVIVSCSGSGTGPSGFVDIGHNNPGVVLASGDSVTFGLDSSGNTGYRKSLERLLSARGIPVTVVNGGRPGVVSRNIHLVMADIARYLPAVVVLQYGVNDAMVTDDKTAPGVVGNVRQMVYGALDNKSIVVLTTLTPTCGYRTEQNKIINKINAGLLELATEFGSFEGFVLADVAKAFTDKDPAGGGCALISSANFNHPNDTGYEVMAQVIADTLEPLSW